MAQCVVFVYIIVLTFALRGVCQHSLFFGKKLMIFTHIQLLKELTVPGRAGYFSKI